MLRFIDDPGHAWLEVPREAVKKAGVLAQVSEYSYQSRDGRTLYLEEDCDAPLYLRKAGGPKIVEVHLNPCFVRGLPGFKVA